MDDFQPQGNKTDWPAFLICPLVMWCRSWLWLRSWLCLLASYRSQVRQLNVAQEDITTFYSYTIYFSQPLIIMCLYVFIFDEDTKYYWFEFLIDLIFSRVNLTTVFAECHELGSILHKYIYKQNTVKGITW